MSFYIGEYIQPLTCLTRMEEGRGVGGVGVEGGGVGGWGLRGGLGGVR